MRGLKVSASPPLSLRAQPSRAFHSLPTSAGGGLYYALEASSVACASWFSVPVHATPITQRCLGMVQWPTCLASTQVLDFKSARSRSQWQTRDVDFCVVSLDAFALCIGVPRYLYLDNNHLGHLPESFGHLKKLKCLDDLARRSLGLAMVS